MASNEVRDDGGVKTVEVRKGSLRDRRAMEIRETGVVVTHRFTSTTALPVEFQVVDPFPGELKVEEIGFHPDQEPPNGHIDGDQAVMRGVVGPDDELVVTYGVRLATATPIEDVELLQVDHPPAIELSKTLDPDDVAEADRGKAAMTRSSSTTEPAAGESVAFFDWLRRSLKGEELRGGANAPDAGGEPPSPTGAAEDTTVEPGPAEPGPADRASDRLGERTGRDDTGASAGAASEPALRDDAGAGEGRERADGAPVAEELIEQLESGSLTDDQRRRLGAALLDLLESDETPRFSTEVRLSRLEAKLQEFEAYADALGAIIDEHGPAEEFLGEVRAELRELGSSVDELRAGLDRSTAARESLGEQLDAVADEVAVIASRLERIDERVESLRADHRSKVTSIEGRIDSLQPTVDQVEDLSRLVDTLRDDVTEVRSRHRAIKRAFVDDDSRQE